ncbi:RNA-binding S4 domain-containing protein [Cohaesibacter gelatinilyticus]|uniref:Heat shock protein Hsp15 n=1 Tax=Cohaesibacter gelatinilyticus TaxID=372072 RepID=A0A285PJN4_9HYPH|nr:RNA-binding S4 domain-containing protein [Cohaesibacter gelatinilyticus]SNZ21477.1 heat shock protein Hsp15 [Cohaesibacter gelatinilyticus]
MQDPTVKLRIDKWLWYARVAKTRTLAAKLVGSGHVRVNSEKILAAKFGVKEGDVLTIARDSRIRILKIAALGERRGPASEAQLLYEDLTPVVEKTAKSPEPVVDKRDAGAGRPTKRDRRQIMRFKNGD